MQMESDAQEQVLERPVDVLNHELLLQYKNLKKGLLKRLIDAYLEEAPKYFAKIRVGVENENYAAIVANCHALKSCSGNLGVIRLSRTCQLMENAAKEQNKDDVLELFQLLGPQAFEAEEALKGETLER